MTMEQSRRIALLIRQDLSFSRNVIRGVREYALGKPNWVFRNGPASKEVLPLVRDWNPHGIIADLYHKDFARRLVRLGKPLIDTGCTIAGLDVPVVDVDHAAVGRMAAEYFLNLGFQNFGYFGVEAAVNSRLREESFQQRLAEAGLKAATCYEDYLEHVASTTSWRVLDRQTRRWLRDLPKPVAIFACNDIPARALADACSQLGLHIPSQVALLGVDNDDLECSLTVPPLSSIAIPDERIGYEAARLLDEIMSGGRRPSGPLCRVPPSTRQEGKAASSGADIPVCPIGRVSQGRQECLPHCGERHGLFLPPVRVMSRQSTDTLAVSDPVVSAAMHYISEHATEGVNVASVVLHIGVHRRELERKFRQIVGHSVLHELRRTRVEHAKRLLAATTLSMPRVARQSGFSTPQRMATVFQSFERVSPTAYRRRVRG
jgi:LacI family transcriptional regulator